MSNVPQIQTTQGPTPAGSSKAELEGLGDQLLIDRSIGGEPLAYEVLIERYVPMVIGYLYGRTRCEGDAEDLAQDILLKAHCNLLKLRDRNRFGPWLMRIARSRLIDYYRTTSKRPTMSSLGEPGESDPAARGWEAREPSPGPSDRAYLAEVKQLVFYEISRLSEKYRVVLYMRLVGEETTAQIAQRTGLRESVVRSRLYRGFRLLRKALKKHGIEPDLVK